MKKDLKVYVTFVLLAEMVGLIAGFISSSAMSMYAGMNADIPLAPPAILFPIVWTILYALMGISAARIWLAGPSAMRSDSLKIYVVQLVVNFFWSIIFFNFNAYGFAFVWILLLWILIILMIVSFNKVDTLAAKWQIPYLLWVTFAAYLNFAVWVMN